MATRGLISSGLTIPPAQSINAAASARPLAAAGARSLVPVTYGIDRQPALILNVLPKAAAAGTLLVQCLWGHALWQVAELQLNDQALPAGTTATHYTGSQTTPDADLVAAFAAQGITYTDSLAGYAYSVVAMRTAAFEGQLNISALLYGRKLYDPRKDSTAGGSGAHRLADPATWEFSTVPALALADWTANTLYGAGEPVLWASVGPAADANDALIGSPAERRRTIGLTLLRDGVGIATMAEALRAYAGCWLVPTAAGMRLLPDADAAPAASYSHALGQIARLEALQLRDLGAVPTAVEIKFTNVSQTPWREDSAIASVPGAGTTKPWRLSSVQLPGVQRYSQAYREAVERLNKLNLGDMSCTVEVFDAGMAHDRGDIITLTHPVGLAAKPMRVTDVDALGPGRWRLAVTEHDPAAYSEEVVTAPTVPDTNRTAVGGPASNVTGFTGSVLKGRIVWAWAPSPDAAYGYTELRPTDASWGLTSPAPTFRGAATSWPQDVAAAGTYTLRARHFDVLGNPSAAAAVATVTVTAGDLVVDGADGAAGAPGPAGPGQFTLVARGYAVVDGRTATKVGGPVAWDSDAYSLESYNGGAFMSFRAGSMFGGVMAGLNSDPTTPNADPSTYTALDFAWYPGSDGVVYIFESGANVANFTPWSTATVFAITYDGKSVRYLRDGAVMRTVAVAPNLRLHFDSAFISNGDSVTDIAFGPMGARGDDGAPGINGVAGAPGTSVAEVNVYIRSTSTPPNPSGGSFNFSTQVLSPPAGWSVGVPSGTDPVYVARGLASTGTPGATVTPTWGSAAAAFADGQSVDVIFRRASSEPSTPAPTTGVPAGWYATVATVPAGSDPLWSSFGERASPAASWVWQAAVRVQGLDGATGPAGPTGPAGLAGAPGTSVAELNAYIRSSSAPPAPSGGSFNFSTQALTAPAGWSVGVPTGTDPVYVVRGLASTGTPGATVTPSWGTPAAAFADGQAVDVVFIRAASQPSTPGASSGVPSGWYGTVASVPAGVNPLWSSFGRRPSPAGNWAWEAPVQVQGLDGATGPAGPTGAAGLAGAPGTSVAEINAYIRSSSAPSGPSGGSFNFGTQVLTPPAGWSVGVPTGTDPVYVVRGLASTGTPGATVTPSWGTPAAAFADGQAVDVVFIRAASQPSTPSASSGVPAGWYATVASVPVGGNPLWSSFGRRASPAANWQWEAPVQVQGLDGAAGPAGPSGPAAAPTVRVQLSQPAIVLAANFDGTVASFAAATITVAVYVDEALDAAWSVSRSAGSGITTTLAGSTVSVTAATTDSSYVDVTASRSGYTSQTIRVPVTKARSQIRPEVSGSYSAVAGGLSPNDSVAAVEFLGNGQVTIYNGGSTETRAWYAPTTTGVGAGYEISFAPVSSSGSTGGESGAGNNTWLSLASSRNKTLTSTENSIVFRSRNYTYAIRRVSDGVEVASGPIYLEASVEV